MNDKFELIPKSDETMRINYGRLRAAEDRWGRESPLAGNANTMPKPALNWWQRLKRWWRSP